MHFPRPQLAQSLTQELLGKAVLSDASNGLFLAAARRTGKTEFLKQDLKPALEAAGVLVIYIDLWADKTRSPMALIAGALAHAIDQSLGVVAKTAKQTGLDSFSLGGFKIDTSKIGKTDGMTLHEVLALVRKQSGKPIALIIDEAQHALTTAEGDATMSALKSARDQLRDSAGAGLLLVMSGSHRDKLLRLLNTYAAPFWGSQVRALPTLGRPFVEHVAKALRSALNTPIEDEGLAEVFTLCGERPQFLFDALRQAQEAPSNENGTTLEERVLRIAKQRRAHDRNGLSQMYIRLPVLEQAILWRLMDKADAFVPFDAAALAFYADRVASQSPRARHKKPSSGYVRMIRRWCGNRSARNTRSTMWTCRSGIPTSSRSRRGRRRSQRFERSRLIHSLAFTLPENAHEQ